MASKLFEMFHIILTRVQVRFGSRGKVRPIALNMTAEADSKRTSYKVCTLPGLGVRLIEIRRDLYANITVMIAVPIDPKSCQLDKVAKELLGIDMTAVSAAMASQTVRLILPQVKVRVEVDDKVKVPPQRNQVNVTQVVEETEFIIKRPYLLIFLEPETLHIIATQIVNQKPEKPNFYQRFQSFMSEQFSKLKIKK